MRLHLTLLGEPKLMLDGAPLTGFISMKAQALLIYLAVIPGLHSRDTLATHFWDEMPEAAAKKNLTKALSNLRKLTGDYIMTDTQSAGLNSVAGGGETVAALHKAGVADDFASVSTAGGAFLEWLEGKALPGVEVLRRND